MPTQLDLQENIGIGMKLKLKIKGYYINNKYFCGAETYKAELGDNKCEFCQNQMKEVFYDEDESVFVCDCKYYKESIFGFIRILISN